MNQIRCVKIEAKSVYPVRIAGRNCRFVPRDSFALASRSIWANGFHWLILLNEHGGNEQPTWAAAVKLAEEDTWPVALSYWNMANDELRAGSESDEGSIGHGGEWETSLQLYLRPPLVDMTWAVKDDWRLKFSDQVGRYAKFPERRREMAHGVMGDPFVASVEKGDRHFAVLLERLIAHCREYHEIELPRYRELEVIFRRDHEPHQLMAASMRALRLANRLFHQPSSGTGTKRRLRLSAPRDSISIST